jgi:ActR/RegA family two-component response regulator
MLRKVLFVDDEANILDTFRVSLRKSFEVSTALGPEEGLKAVREAGPFAVVVSDLKMPKMDGIAFFSQVRELAPDTVRIMLTGFAEVDVAIGAVNEGQVFRFLTKPCPLEVLTRTLEAGLEQHRLVTSEKELLRGTLRGSIRVLTEVLSLANPEAFGRSERVRRLVGRLAEAMGIKGNWELDLAAMLSHIGCVALPRELVHKISAGKLLTPEEQKVYENHPAVGAGLLEHIPRLGSVSAIIADQLKPHDPARHLGARILRVAIDYDRQAGKGIDPFDICARLRGCKGCYDPAVLDALERTVRQGGYAERRLRIREFKDGMILDESVVTRDGLVLLAKGAELNEESIYRLIKALGSFQVTEPVAVLVPTA